MARAAVAEDGIVQTFPDGKAPDEMDRDPIPGGEDVTPGDAAVQVRLSLMESMDAERKALKKWVAFRDKIVPKLAELEADYRAKSARTAELFSLATDGLAR